MVEGQNWTKLKILIKQHAERERERDREKEREREREIFVLHQNRVLHNFRKRGQHSMVQLKKCLD